MTEPLVDLRGLLRGLHEHNVEYLVFGALAMTFYGYVRNSEDLDIVVAPDQGNLEKVGDWLISIDAVLKLNPQRRFGPRERRGNAEGLERHEEDYRTLRGEALGRVELIRQAPDFDLLELERASDVGREVPL